MLAEKVKKLDEEKADRQLRSFTVHLQIPSKALPAIIGTKGATITKLSKQFNDVRINLRKKDGDKAGKAGAAGASAAADTASEAAGVEGEAAASAEPVSAMTPVEIVGYEKDVHACRDAILAIVKEQESIVEDGIEIDPRTHRFIIGRDRAGILRLQSKYGVQVIFPMRERGESRVVIRGDADSVEDCKTELLDLEDEFMVRVEEEEERRAESAAHIYQRVEEKPTTKPGTPLLMTGAPWQQSPPPSTADTAVRACACFFSVCCVSGCLLVCLHTGDGIVAVLFLVTHPLLTRSGCQAFPAFNAAAAAAVAAAKPSTSGVWGRPPKL